MVLNIKRAKTETLSLRLDPKTKFMLDFVSRVEGQSITTVVERAIRDVAGRVGIQSEWENGSKTWAHYWDASEGMRALQLYADADYPTTFEEDEILRFAKTHWPFFYTTDKATTLRRPFVDLLWPKIGEYLAVWQNQRHQNYWAAGQAMKADLVAAQVQAPDWPIPPTKPAQSKPTRESFAADLDDEIPF
jgi:predicted transcriptional regulator